VPPSPTSEPDASGLVSFDGRQVQLRLTNVPPAPTGKVYVGWLGDPNGSIINVGAIDPAAVPDAIYTDPQSRNLIGLFNSFQITLEDKADEKAPTGAIALGGSIAPEALDAVRQILVESTAPGGQGLAASMLRQAEVMFQHAKLASDALTAGDFRGAKQHSEHVINIAAGQDSPQFGDHDGNGAAENPGDGFGVAVYARRAIELVQLLGETGVSEETRQVILQGTACAANVENRSLDAIQAALDIIAASDTSAATLAGVRMVSLANAADTGADANNNGTIENAKDECGATQLLEIVPRLADIPLHPPSR
jgi:hypothetical protein